MKNFKYTSLSFSLKRMKQNSFIFVEELTLSLLALAENLTRLMPLALGSYCCNVDNELEENNYKL